MFVRYALDWVPLLRRDMHGFIGYRDAASCGHGMMNASEGEERREKEEGKQWTDDDVRITTLVIPIGERWKLLW